MKLNHLTKTLLNSISHSGVPIKRYYPLKRRIHEFTHILHRHYGCQTRNILFQQNQSSVPLRLFIPSAPFPNTVLLFFHGGGWVIGNAKSYSTMCASLANTMSVSLCSVSYPLAPESPFPAALETCLEVYLAIRKAGVGRIILCGDSAGGNLCAALSLYLRDHHMPPPDGQILLYPVTANDHTPASPFASIRDNGSSFLLTSKRVCDYTDLYCANEQDRRSPYFAPLLAGDFSCQPPTLILTAEYDPLRDEGEAYGKALADAGAKVQVHRITDGLHGYFMMGGCRGQQKESYQKIISFLNSL